MVVYRSRCRPAVDTYIDFHKEEETGATGYPATCRSLQGRYGRIGEITEGKT